MKKVGKTTRPVKYDLNQIPNDYTVGGKNRFKVLDLIECLNNYGQTWDSPGKNTGVGCHDHLWEISTQRSKPNL